ncbi:MAG: TonB-dependent receptor [Xanthomonadales bacterium]|nr:TonB-dependent receptor [Xanthomonadales bacterium]
MAFLLKREGLAPPLVALLATLWAGFASEARAQQAPSGDEAAIERVMELVHVTAMKREASLYEVTEAVSVIDAEQIARRAPDMIAEMLRGVPGAFFQQTTPGQGIPIIRGLKGSQVLHLVDGMRLNNAFFRNAPNQYLGLVDAYATDRAEVVRGAAPSLYGADAMGGVLQILTAEPEFEGAQRSNSGRLYGSFNSADTSFVGRLEGATGNERQVLSGGVTYQSHDDRSVGGGETIRPSGYRAQAADIKWRGQLGADSELMLSAQYLEQPSTPRVDELVAGFGQQHPSSEVFEFMPNRREFLHARYRLHSDSRWFSRFEAHLARQVITDDRLTQEFGSDEQVREANESELDGLTLQFNSPWEGASVSGEAVWGFEYYSDDIASSRLRIDTRDGSASPARGRFPDGSTMDSAGLFASSHWSWERLSLDAGLRYSWFEIGLPASEEVAAVRLTPSDLTGDVHLGYELRPGLQLVANIGRGFRPPNIFDLGTLGSRPGNRFNVPNPGLEPESVWSYDIGIKNSGERWQLEAFAWYSDYRDKISSRFTGEVTPEGRLVVRSDNLNSVELYGLESGFSYQAAERIEIYGVVNFTRGEETEPGGVTEPADRIPPLNGRLGAVYAAPAGVRLEPYLDFAAQQDRLNPRDESDPRINPLGTPGWATVNLAASWETNPGTELGLRLLNLADRNYREHGSGIDAPGRSLGLWFSTSF